MAEQELERQYTFTNGEFYCEGTGKVVAKLNENNELVFAPGCKGPHTATLNAWLAKTGLSFGSRYDEPEEPEEPEESEESEKLEETEEQVKKKTGRPKVKPESPIDDIPDLLLPPFDKTLGTATPGFREFVKYYKLDEEQQIKLIRRLERRK